VKKNWESDMDEIHHQLPIAELYFSLLLYIGPLAIILERKMRKRGWGVHIVYDITILCSDLV